MLDNLREKRMHKIKDLFSESLQLLVLFDQINIIINLSKDADLTAKKSVMMC